jgi:LuxR family maltose regulon positive regulatory protein
MPERLLATKLFIPPARPDLVPRSRLLGQLDAGLEAGCLLTFVSAPAGYGKTTLIGDWISSLKGPRRSGAQPSPASATPIRCAWLSLDEKDDDPARFFAYWIAALQKIDPDVGLGAQSLLGMQALPPAEALMTELINDAAALDQPFILVLDDYHVLRNQELHAAVEFWLERQPPLAHLVLTTRVDPPLPLSRLRARRQMTEIRVRELRFSQEEARAFFNDLWGLNLDPESVGILEARIEGWIAGLQLAALAMNDERQRLEPSYGDGGASAGGLEAGPEAERLRIAAFVSRLGGSHRYVIDYLVDEVLKRQPPQVAEFLTRTAILERFNAGLCAAVTGMEAQDRPDGDGGALLDAAQILEYLARANLFLIPLDDRQGWYRYHHLFADALRAGLTEALEVELHRRAAAWLEQQGYLAEAVPHWLAGEGTGEAARLIARSASELLSSGEMHTFLGWTRALPPEALSADIDLGLYQALVLLMTGQVRQAGELIQRLEPAVQDSAAWARLLALKSWLAAVMSNAEMLPLAAAALDGLQEGDYFFRVLAYLAQGSGQSWSGDLQASTRSYRLAYEVGQSCGHHLGALGALANLVYNHYELGNLREAFALCEAALRYYVDRRGLPLPVLGLIYLPLGSLYYEINNLPRAREYARNGRELTQKLFSSGMMGGDAEHILILTAFEAGEVEGAFALLNDTRRFGQEHQVAYLVFKMDLVEVSLRLRLGEVEAARRLLEALDQRSTGVISSAKRAVSVLQARLLVAQDRPAEALTLLAGLEARNREQGADGRLITVHILQALALQALGDETEALRALEQAVSLAAPEGYRRSFLEAGPALASLLPGVRPLAPDFVDELLRSLTEGGLSQAGGESAGPQKRPTSAAPAGRPGARLVEPLSEQELNVLRLMVAGLSNAEIAERLVIGVGTAKWHVHNILGKLEVNSRGQATARARELDLV